VALVSLAVAEKAFLCSLSFAVGSFIRDLCTPCRTKHSLHVRLERHSAVFKSSETLFAIFRTFGKREVEKSTVFDTFQKVKAIVKHFLKKMQKLSISHTS
jgi:hypothetical protein